MQNQCSEKTSWKKHPGNTNSGKNILGKTGNQRVQEKMAKYNSEKTFWKKLMRRRRRKKISKYNSGKI